MSNVILYLTTLESGGAADCTFNTHKMMLNSGYRSYVAVNGEKLYTPEGDIIKIPYLYKKYRWDRIKIKEKKYLLDKKSHYVDEKYAPHNLDERICYFNPNNLLSVLPECPNIIYVHWVSGFANAKYISVLQKETNAKVYFVMIDEAILSGACHYSWKCVGITNGCKNCPMTTSRLLKLHIRWNFFYKQLYLPKEKNVILGSKYDENKLRKSKIWRNANVNKIYAKIDSAIFHPSEDKEIIKQKWGLPLNKKIIFFGCSYLSEIRKGMSLLFEAINNLKREDIVCVVVGEGNLPNIKVNTIKLGRLNINDLAEVYRAADVFVCSSLEDSGPQMVNMALMSGCPTVAFETGVALDFVQTGQTGYLAKWGDANDLAHGIDYVLGLSLEEYEKVCKNCRSIAVEHFADNSNVKLEDTK